jgi:hypothetical protein
MRTSVAVMASDAVNLKNMRADTGSLYTAIQSRFASGLPQLMSHDRHRLAGWVVPSALHFSPGLTRLLATVYMPETAQDKEIVLRFASRHFAAELAEIPEESRRELEGLLESKLLGNETTWNVGAHALRSTDLARRCFPEIFALKDKDGLIPMDILEMIRPGVFQVGELCVFAHAFLRRSESAVNQFNAELLETLDRLKGSDSARVRVQLDPDMVGLAKTAPFPVELDYWYGPKFNDDLSAIASGVTVHGADETQRFYHELSRTEFWWQRRRNDLLDRTEMILEAEELRDAESGTDHDKFRCRYVHSVIDEESRRIEHLDGAIRAYDDTEMLSRLDVNLMHVERKTDYKKLWRVDGDLHIHDWKTLIHNFFRGNPLIAEYFGQTSDSQNQPAPATEAQESYGELDRLIPWVCESAADLQVMLTRHPGLLEELTCERRARPTQWASNTSGEIPLFDFWFLELKKILMKAGQSVELPDETQFLSFYDDHIEMPMIMHRNRQALEGTMVAYRQFLDETERTWPGTSISLELGLAASDYVQSLSLFGLASEVREWMMRKEPFPPEANTEEWVGNAATFLEKFGSASSRSMALSALSKDELVLHPRRVDIPRKFWTLTEGSLLVGREELPPDVVEAVQQNEVELAPCDRVVASACNLCGESYLVCACSKFIDGAAPESELRFAFPYWKYAARSFSSGEPVASTPSPPR